MIVCDGKIKQNGFGNEFFGEAKALVCSRKFDLPFLKPHWPAHYSQALPDSLNEPYAWKDWINRQRYGLTHKIIEFTEKDHLATGIISVEEAFPVFLRSRGITLKDNALMRFPALFPGLECIEKHGRYLKEMLLEKGWLALRVREKIQHFPKDQLLVGIHIRRGDFRDPLPLGKPWPKDKWNIRIPLEWYVNICHKLYKLLEGNIEFAVFSNGNDDELNHLSSELPMHIFTGDDRRSSMDLVDMLVLSGCDIIISSPSWFSGWAAIFSDSPVLWYSCAHGRPPWKKDKIYQYVDEESLSEGLRQDALNILQTKMQNKQVQHG